MKIGELARRSGVKVETLRYYEREGLLPEPERSDGNYRVYRDAHAERLDFIRHCRALDMTLDEIRALLVCQDHPEHPCEDADALIEAHLGHVEQRIAQLSRLKAELERLRQRCAGHGTAGECGILNELAQPVGDVSRGGDAGVHVGGAHPRR
ncbi:Cd(II)/Pb(II)-responsive transcriptional regulator [Halomonas denitrificans]|uniref:Cd(II)/Pb(II)-responsive transcriptional regulator n=1 Tax=Halomonas denitrificans TaxID=370769 RepID=UPI001C999D64|nr:Cd(II)/Pb(II)-responsive transcriptional regulator [Halomonas denitrificans]MBY5967445.1 Cd(II)/Pb(II)-responsive transcriptional regulator [Halomonas denitrificans]